MNRTCLILNRTALILNGAYLLYKLVTLFSPAGAAFLSGEAGAIGVIGGADGPTAIFIAGNLLRYYLPLLLLLAFNTVTFLINIRSSR